MTRPQAIALMVLVTFMWSIAGLVTRHLEHARSFEVTFWRSFFTVLSLLILLPALRGRRVFATLPWRSGLFWLSGLCWCVMFTAFMLALSITTVATVLVTMSIGPLLTALFARIFIGHHIALRTWGAIAVAGLGMVYMQWGGVGVPDWAGFGVALCVPVGGAVQWTLMQYSQAKSGHQDAPDLVSSVMLGAALSCLVTLPLALPLQANVHDVRLLALLGLVQLAIPCLLAVLCAAVLKAPELSLLQLLEVIFGILLVWVGVGEAPAPSVLIGGAMVLAALVVNEALAWRQKND